MAVNLKKVRWMAVNGSILTEDKFKVKFEFTGFREVHETVAINVGQDLAQRIAMLHNIKLVSERGE